MVALADWLSLIECPRLVVQADPAKESRRHGAELAITNVKPAKRPPMAWIAASVTDEQGICSLPAAFEGHPGAVLIAAAAA